MAIIHCPNCNRRVSSLAPSCSHCDVALGSLSDAQREQLRLRRWKRRLYRALNLSYLGLALLLTGIAVWWFSGPSGSIPPLTGWGIGLAVLGCAVYLIGRGWSGLLRLERRRWSVDRKSR